MYDIIAKKRDGGELAKNEIDFFIKGYLNGEVADYQISALLMAIYLNGMNAEETANLTLSMAQSGEMLDLSSISGIKVDKHSTGGVGDKTSFIISPIVASLGVKVAKMSGRGLGHTGGTTDKLQSIPGMRVSLDRSEFLKIVREVGVCLISQSNNLVPADKMIYALRDVTATVDCLPLIASSIMSKKIAAGSDCILLDVKAGSGAFTKTVDDAIKLAKFMVEIGENAGRKTVALITDMDRPLGRAIGNSLEIIEACETLKGNGPKDLTDICVELAANMLYFTECESIDACKDLVKKAILDGSAFEKLKEMINAQGGDVAVLEDSEKFEKSKVKYDVIASESGFVTAMNTEKIGIASVILGAGRATKDSQIDYSAGIILTKKSGDFVNKGEKFATLFSASDELCKTAEKIIFEATKLSSTPPIARPYIHARVVKNGKSIEVLNYTG
jgi:pyrimidine-nucleoside phosphorylase